MLRFRPPTPDGPGGSVADLLAVGQLIDDAMRPGHFFAAPELRLKWIAGRSETIPWELFRGRLLDARQTRNERTFLSWHVVGSGEPATEPIVSVKLDVHARQIYVTRGLLAYVWEGHDAGGGVIESREVVQWTRELVGTIFLGDFADLESLRDELICLIWHALVGTSRLPLTSVEAPLPAYVFGQLHYVYRNDAPETPMTRWEDLIPAGTGPEIAALETVKLIEFILRGASTLDSLRLLPMLAGTSSPFVKSWHGWTKLWRELFNNVSLSPPTSLVANTLICTAIGLPVEERMELDGHLLCKLCRHLTAYDLINFHHRGANYPDALLLDDILKRFTAAAEPFFEFFMGGEPKARMARRSMRQACLMRRYYEGHLVPDLPTSPGENARVMPATHPRVPEEQITQTLRRRRALFAEDPLARWLAPSARTVLAESMRDLENPDERVELGLGVFIDRPLGYGKQVGEPDLTPLLAYEAFSPSLARRRWRELKALCAELAIPCDAGSLDPLFERGRWPAGLPHADIADCPRPTAALGDVRKVADDFVILRTLPRGLAAVCARILPLLQGERLACATWRLLAQVRGDEPTLVLFDQELRRRVEMVVDASAGFRVRAGVEWPRAGLRVVRVWDG